MAERCGPRRPVLLGAVALSTLMALPSGLRAQEEARELDPIVVRSWFWSRLTGLGTADPADTGTTEIGAESLKTRGTGSGDANEALKALPTVQTAGDASLDAGENGDDALDLRPLEFSISGGRTDENAILVDGIPVNSITGNEDPLGSDPLSRETGQPNIYAIYGLHSQAQFVPESLLERASVIDSNASAEYGGFQGGVVKYELAKPSRESSGSVSFSYQNQEFTHYSLGTLDGTNPNDVGKPDWEKLNFAVKFTQPVGERGALVFGYSTRRATAEKDMDPQYRSRRVGSDSHSDYLLLGYEYELTNGNRLSFSGTVSDYEQDWDSNFAEDLRILQTGKSHQLRASYSGTLADRDIAGVALSNLKFSLDASYQNNATENIGSSDTFYVWYGAYTGGSANYHTDAFDDWCDTSIAYTGTGISCRRGGIGDRAYDDKTLRLSAEMSGDVWRGSFKLGADIEHSDASRNGSGFTQNSATTRTETGSYICPPGADDCIDTQFFSTRIVQEAYDVGVNATKIGAYLTLDQQWGDFGIRAGLRADYNDVLENLDIAPRFVATWKPQERLSLSFGANRYYSDKYLAYAIHDAVPRGLNQRRTADADGVVGDWSAGTDLNIYSYTGQGLKTPYTDELTLSATWNDRWTDGTWRIRAIDRTGKDQFAGVRGATTRDRVLTNEGTSKYRSFIVEYDKKWDMRHRRHLDAVGFNFSAAYAEREISAESYFGDGRDDVPDEFIWYKEKSYTLSEFGVVTGNLDIPVKASAEINGSWNDGRIRAGLSADITFGYSGARDTGDTATRTHPEYGSQTHYLYEEYDYDAVLTFNLAASAQVAEIRSHPLNVDLRVSNLLDDTGNRISTYNNPWIRGRTVWLGTSMSW